MYGALTAVSGTVIEDSHIKAKKVKLLCLIRHYAMKAYQGVEIQFPAHSYSQH